MSAPTRETRASKRKSLAESDAAPPPKKQNSGPKPTKKAAASKAKPKAKPKAKAPERAPTRSASSSPPSDPPRNLRTPSPFPPGRPAAAPTPTPVVTAGTLSPAIQAAITTAVREAIRPFIGIVGPIANHTRACARLAAGSGTMQDVNRQQELVFRAVVRMTRELGGAPPDGIEETDGAIALDGPSGREDSGEEDEGTRKPKKGGSEDEGAKEEVGG